LVYLCPAGAAIDSSLLPDHILAPAPTVPDAPQPSFSLDLRSNSDQLERRLIRLALLRARGNQRRAAALLGLSRNGLANRLKRLGLGATDTEPADEGSPGR
jgi:DNA-binding NtrC family response regulator